MKGRALAILFVLFSLLLTFLMPVSAVDEYAPIKPIGGIIEPIGGQVFLFSWIALIIVISILVGTSFKAEKKSV